MLDYTVSREAGDTSSNKDRNLRLGHRQIATKGIDKYRHRQQRGGLARGSGRGGLGYKGRSPANDTTF